MNYRVEDDFGTILFLDSKSSKITVKKNGLTIDFPILLLGELVNEAEKGMNDEINQYIDDLMKR